MAQKNKTARLRKLRNLEDLNLIDNFLFQEMLAQEDGYEFGFEKINMLNKFLIEDGRMEDLVKAAKDKEYQKKLLEEYQLQDSENC